MDTTTRDEIRRRVAAAKALLPELENDIADAKKAGLTAQVQYLETYLASAKDALQKLEAVYG